jgi:hypothetical protein
MSIYLFILCAQDFTVVLNFFSGDETLAPTSDRELSGGASPRPSPRPAHRRRQRASPGKARAGPPAGLFFSHARRWMRGSLRSWWASC